MKKTNKHKRYTKRIKLEAVHRVLDGDEPVQSVIKDLGIRHRDNVYVWIKKYKCEGEHAFDRHIGRNVTVRNDNEKEIQELRAEVDALKKYLQILHQGEYGSDIRQLIN